MGSALMGSLQVLRFRQRHFGAPVDLVFPKVPGRTFFPNLSKIITFAAAPLVLTPFVRNQGMHLLFTTSYYYLLLAIINYNNENDSIMILLVISVDTICPEPLLLLLSLLLLSLLFVRNQGAPGPHLQGLQYTTNNNNNNNSDNNIIDNTNNNISNINNSI